MPEHHLPEFKYQSKAMDFPLRVPIIADSIENSMLYHQTNQESLDTWASLELGIGYCRDSKSSKSDKINKEEKEYTLSIYSGQTKFHKAKITFTP